jgi:hypothetical protein
MIDDVPKGLFLKDLILFYQGTGENVFIKKFSMMLDPGQIIPDLGLPKVIPVFFLIGCGHAIKTQPSGITPIEKLPGQGIGVAQIRRTEY